VRLGGVDARRERRRGDEFDRPLAVVEREHPRRQHEPRVGNPRLRAGRPDLREVGVVDGAVRTEADEAAVQPGSSGPGRRRLLLEPCQADVRQRRPERVEGVPIVVAGHAVGRPVDELGGVAERFHVDLARVDPNGSERVVADEGVAGVMLDAVGAEGAAGVAGGRLAGTL